MVESEASPVATYQDEHTAFEADLKILAEETGLPEATVEGAMTFQEASAKYFDELMSRYPDQIAGIWVEPMPATTGHVVFVGDVPTEARELAVERGLDIVFSDGTEIPLEVQRLRAELAAQALLENGYQAFATSFDQSEQVIQIELKIPAGGERPDFEDVLKVIRERVASDARLTGRSAEVLASDLNLTVIESDIPAVDDAYRRQIEGSPLAIWDANRTFVYLMTRSGEGTLDISEHCVLLEHENGYATLLVWPAPTTWDADSQTIKFVDVEGHQFDLQEGDRLAAGGAEAMGGTPYVKPPDPACNADSIFVLHSIELLSD